MAKYFDINCSIYTYKIKYKNQKFLDKHLKSPFCHDKKIDFINKDDDLCFFHFASLQTYKYKNHKKNKLFKGKIELRQDDFVNLGITENQYHFLLAQMGLGVGLAFILLVLLLTSSKIKIWDVS